MSNNGHADREANVIASDEEQNHTPEETQEQQDTPGETQTTIPVENLKWNGKCGAPWEAVIVLAVLLLVSVICSISLMVRRKRQSGKQKTLPAGQMPETDKAESNVTERLREIPVSAAVPKEAVTICSAVGKVHNIGRRSTQQDSLGVTAYQNGMLAVVADGMGGLADGDKVSQKIVLTMLQDGAVLAGGNTEGNLYQMTAHVNSEVNHMLGVSDRYKSGSTLIAVLVEAGNFQWVSVGDSRIYLYRGQELLQINREHVYEMDLIHKAVNYEISFAEIASNPQRKSVSSFIGMGELKYIDGSMHPVSLKQGDRLLLMSDGVFNTLSEQEICDVLSRESNAAEAALALEEQVLARRNPKQDNFTAIILDI